ncbi:HNH endonuclease [Pseudomonas brassicacearum]|uniref:HNH endonuclease n=1 Tax=Pseudomonas brassicacearum TaxID=930166 RepID=UPI00068DDB81|nr:HNH endonuclease [Pseudomonas brassicacearum]
MKTRQLTHARLLEKVVYDPDTGKFTHLGRRRPKVGQFDKDGYVKISIDGIKHQAHRLAWLYMTGSYPPADMHVDHRNAVRDDNRWQNLRLATYAENQAYRIASTSIGPGRGASGVRGVYWDGRKERWFVQVRSNKKVHCGGYHVDVASAAIEAAALRNQIQNERASP